MASLVYNSAKRDLINGTIDLDTHDIRVALVKSTYTESAAHDFMDDVVATEADATNYVRKALANEAVAVDAGNNRAEFDADDVVWTSLGGATNNTIKGAVVYKHVGGTDSANPLICFIDFPSDITTDGNNLTLTFNAEGILQLA